MLTPGQIFAGDFRIERKLSEGGMGAVFVATQLSVDAQRALKVMQPQLLADDAARRRFAQEARIGGRIKSQHVVQVVAAGIDATTQMPWLAMELLDGADLAAYVESRGRVPFEELAAIFKQLGHALSRAHAAGIVHRDLKPENLFVAHSDIEDMPFMVKVLDFGIAKLTLEASHRSTALIGSPMWMAPEQTEPGVELTPRTDVWALGLIAFHALTGKPYWRSANAATISVRALITEVIAGLMPSASERLRELGAPSGALPEGFDGWFARCTTREPSHRFAEGGEACKALLALRARGEPSASVPVRPPIAATLPMSELQRPRPIAATTPMQVPPTAPVELHATSGEHHESDARPSRGSTPYTATTDATDTEEHEARRARMGRLVIGVTAAFVAGAIGVAFLMSSGTASDESLVDTLDQIEVEQAAAARTPEPRTEPPRREAPIAPMENPFVRINGAPRVRLGLSRESARLTPTPLGFLPSRAVMAPALAYELQQHEVTWGELRANAPGVASSFSMPTWAAALPDASHYPVGGIPHEAAEAYCRTIGARLPSEEEWELAARGSELRPHPWGDAPIDRARTRVYAGSDAPIATVRTQPQDRSLGTELFDMLGNVREWTSSEFRLSARATPDEERWVREDGRIFYAVRGLPPDPAPPATSHPEPIAYRDARCSGACGEEARALWRFVGFRCARDELAR